MHSRVITATTYSSPSLSKRSSNTKKPPLKPSFAYNERVAKSFKEKVAKKAEATLSRKVETTLDTPAFKPESKSAMHSQNASPRSSHQSVLRALMSKVRLEMSMFSPDLALECQ